MHGQNCVQKDSKARAGYGSASLSWLRIVATIAVVVSHTWSTLTDNTDLFFLTAAEIKLLETAYSLTKWAVPAFFMVTGVLLLKKEKEIEIHDCICKYAKRMLIALGVFGIPYAMLMIVFETKTISAALLFKAIVRVINGDSFGHLWYLYTLIGIYLFLPLIKGIVNHMSKRVIQYALILQFIFNFCIPSLNALTEMTIAFKIPLTTYPLFYMLLGYYIFYEKPDWAQKAWIAVSAVAASAIIIVVTGMSGAPLGIIMSYDSPIAVLLTVGVFMLFNKINHQSTARLWKIDRLCFGVYLIHPLFIQFCYKFLNVIPIRGELSMPLSILFAAGFVVISFGASWVMSKIKPLKKYVL